MFYLALFFSNKILTSNKTLISAIRPNSQMSVSHLHARILVGFTNCTFEMCISGFLIILFLIHSIFILTFYSIAFIKNYCVKVINYLSSRHRLILLFSPSDFAVHWGLPGCIQGYVGLQSSARLMSTVFEHEFTIQL